MAIELRRIILDSDELLNAVRSYLRANPRILGTVTVLAVAVRSDGSVALEARRGEQVERDLPLDVGHATGALIRFCLENNIPLPRKARKTAIASGKSLALQIALGSFETADMVEEVFGGDPVRAAG